MKKIITSLVLLLSFASSTFAVYNPDAPIQECPEGQMCIMQLDATISPAPIMQNSYDTSEDLLEAEGQICESAIDGVNTFFINSGELGGSTRMGYPEDFSAEWKCQKYLSENMMGWSINDRNYFNTLLERASDEQKEKVGMVVEKVENLLGGKSAVMQEKYLDAILELIDTLKMEITLSHPQDIALPDDVYEIYSMLSLLRFTLMTM